MCFATLCKNLPVVVSVSINSAKELRFTFPPVPLPFALTIGLPVSTLSSILTRKLKNSLSPIPSRTALLKVFLSINVSPFKPNASGVNCLRDILPSFGTLNCIPTFWSKKSITNPWSA